MKNVTKICLGNFQNTVLSNKTYHIQNTVIVTCGKLTPVDYCYVT